MPQKAPRSVSDLETELNSVKAKLNEQKILVQQLQNAITFWRRKASPNPIAIYQRTYASPFDSTSPGSKESAVRMARMQLLAQWAGEVFVPGEYSVRFEQQFVRSDDTTPWCEYRVSLHVWEK